MTVAHVVPFKRALIDWLGEQLVRDMVRFGIRDTGIMKLDQEPAIVDVLNETARMRGRREDDHRAQPRGGLPGQRICGARHPDRG